MNQRIAIAASFVAATISLGCASNEKATRATTQPATAPSGPVTAKTLVDRVRPSLVVVRYTYDSEMGRRDVEGAGIVVNADGTVIFSSTIAPPGLPDVQMIDFKIIVPPGVEGTEEVEYDATFLGRDERVDIAYVKATKADKVWTALTPSVKPINVGEKIYSVGMLPKGSGYAAYARSAEISANLRGPVPLTIATGGLTPVNSPVFDEAGDFIALVPGQEGQNPLLNTGSDTAVLTNPPVFVVGISDYMASLTDPPTAPGSRKMPWLGVVEMNGLKKEVATYYGLNGKAAIQIGGVVPKGAADAAGLKGGEILTAVNGNELERGDTPEELPVILSRRMNRMSVGEDVTFTIIRKRGAQPEDVKVKLAERPPTANRAPRFYAEDLGYTVRDLVFADRYQRRLDDDFPGVTVTFVKEQGNASAGGLQQGDVVTKINQTDVVDIAQFKQAYEDFRKTSKKESVVLEVLRGVDTQIIRIQPPQ